MKRKLLKTIMAKRRITQKELAESCGISTSAFSKRLNGETEFTLEEIKILSRCLSLTDEAVMSIFFDSKVS